MDSELWWALGVDNERVRRLSGSLSSESDPSINYQIKALCKHLCDKTDDSLPATPADINGCISRDVFLNVIAIPPVCKELGYLLFSYIRRKEASQYPDMISYLNTVETFAEIGLLSNEEDLTTFYSSLFEKSTEMYSKSVLCRLLTVSCCASLASVHASNGTKCQCKEISGQIFEAVIKSMLSHGSFSDCVTQDEFHRWVKQYSPGIFNGLHCCLVHRLLGHDITEDDDAFYSGESYWFSAIKTGKQALNLQLLWYLTTVLPPTYTQIGNHSRFKAGRTSKIGQKNDMAVNLYNRMHFPVEEWTLLYDSDHQGLGYNRFEKFVFDYAAPSIMILATENHQFCLAVDHEWIAYSQSFGGDNCMLLQIIPEISFLINKRPNVIFYNHSNRDLPLGVIIGQKKENPILHFSVSDIGVVKVFGVEERVKRIEVWGCGGSEAHAAQMKIKERDLANIQRRQEKRTSEGDWADSPDRFMLEHAGVATNRPKSQMTS